MPRKKFSCDFETTTKIDDCRVWAYGWMEIGKTSNFRIGNSLDEFMEWCSKINADLYFHNLRFDGEFIVSWLYRNGFKYDKEGKEPNSFKTVISNMGQWYIIDICFGWKGKRKIHTVIYDSLKKLPFPVKKIAKDFNLHIEKGDIDYHTERPIGHEITEDEFKYIKNDIEIIACALQIQYEQGLEKMTTGSDSLHGFKNTISKKVFDRYFPVFSKKLDDEIRYAYRGGFTWLNKRFASSIIDGGIVFDVNSLYPYVMYTMDLPYGIPIGYDGEYKHDDDYPLYIQHVRCSFVVRDGYIPTIQIKGDLRFKGTEYLETSKGEIVDLYVTNVDWEMIQEHYLLMDVEYMTGWKFKKCKGLFNDFIDYWTHIKTTSDGAIKAIAKLMLNSLYGKFASNPDVTGKVPIMKDDGSIGFVEGEKEEKDPIYTPMGVFITSWARWITIGTAQKCYDRIIYCDTDSIHLTGTEIPKAIEDVIDPKKLGFWKFEYEFKRGKYIRQKTYYNEIEKENVCVKKVACAGMTERIRPRVSMNNFKEGFKSKGKLLPKHVVGGVVLVDTEFTIK